MRELINKIQEADKDVMCNAISILADMCERKLCKRDLLSIMKSLKTEVEDGCYNEEMADLHLSIIGQLENKDIAKDYFNISNGIGIHDWCVLWGEMENRHGDKIRKWFPNIQTIDYEKKIEDECINWLRHKNIPFYDLLA